MIIHEVEQGSDAWFKLRAGIPTASEFSKVVTTKGVISKSADTYADRLAYEFIKGGNAESFEGNEWTDRGKEHEPKARAYYSFMNDVDVQEVGFVTDDGRHYGCSPDALVNDDGVLEIKILKPENHIKMMRFHKNNERCPSDYVHQTQGQMMICERAWCDLLFFSPDPEIAPVVIRQLPDLDFQENLKVALNDLLLKRDAALDLINEYAAIERKAA